MERRGPAGWSRPGQVPLPRVPPAGRLPHGTWPGMARQAHRTVCPGHGPQAVAAARCRWKGTRRAARSAPRAGTSRAPPARPRPSRARRLPGRPLVPGAGQHPGPPPPGGCPPARALPLRRGAGALPMLPLPRVPPARRWRREHRVARFARARLAGSRKARRGWPARPSGCPSASWAGYRLPRSWPWRRSPPSSAGCLRQPFSMGPGQRRRPRQAAQPPRRRARRSGRRHRARPVDGRPSALG